MREIFTDDRRQFVDRHFGHEIEALKSVAENRFPIGRPVDPMKVGYVEVTNGRVSFILRVSRSNIADPVSYNLVPSLVGGRSERLARHVVRERKSEKRL